jgi:hypothetical protein
MSNDLVGFMQEEGYSDQDISEILSPMDLYEGHAVDAEPPRGRYDGEPAPTPVERDVHAVLRQARDERKPTVVHVATAPGAVVSPAEDPKAVRVDTEESFKGFRSAFDASPHDDIDAIATAAQDELMGKAGGTLSEAALLGILPAATQACVLCGRRAAGSAACAACRSKHSHLMQRVIGFGERGAASQLDMVGFGERGSAADMYHLYGDEVGYTANQMELATRPDDGFVGYTARQMELLGYTARQMEMLGYTARQMELLGYTARQMELIGEVDALEQPSGDEPSEAIPMSFASPVDAEHIETWKGGPHLYSALRIVGWDGLPRVLTATQPYAKSMGIVVGMMERAGVSPARNVALADTLTRTLGAGELIPRIAAGSPGILRLAHGQEAPFLTAIVPARIHRGGR